MAFKDVFKAVDASAQYRPDIDGMRALAVLAVVAYHYSPANFPGGFIGVDVFFVISGYLITGILARAIEDHEYPTFPSLLSDFYQRRVRRIFPVLILVLAVSLAIGWLTLFASEYARLGKYVAAGAGYVENFVLWSEAGYFDHAAISKPLLHLWSLAVEEQFYIFWPLLLWLIASRRWPLLVTIGLIAVASFALNASLVLGGLTTHAFYSPLARTWELMTGAWLAVAHRRGVAWLSFGNHAQAWLGLLSIAVGFALIGPSSAFPGFWALLPVLGTALVINAGSGTLVNQRLLSWRPVVWIGLISYPLYLWHWALLSLVVTIFGDQDAKFRHASRMILFAASMLLAWLTYRCVEQPIRRSRRLATSLGLGAAVAVLGVIGLTIFLAAGVPDRPASLVSTQAERYVDSIRMSPLSASGQCFNPQTRMTFLQARNSTTHLPSDWYCRLGDKESSTRVLAYGDSHASAMIPALDQYGKAAHVQILFAAIGSCLALDGLEEHTDYPAACRALGDQALRLAATNRPNAVLIMESWTGYLKRGELRYGPHQTGEAALASALAATLGEYHRLGLPVILMQDVPLQNAHVPESRIRFTRNPTDAQLNANAITVQQYDEQQAQANATLKAAASKFPLVSTINPGSAMCDARICPWARDREFLYFDPGHLSVAGSLDAYPALASGLDAVLSRGDSVPNPPRHH